MPGDLGCPDVLALARRVWSVFGLERLAGRRLIAGDEDVIATGSARESGRESELQRIPAW